MTEVINVEFDKKGRLAIEVPYKLNSVARGIPARWSKTQQRWIAPLLRGSIRVLENASKMPGVEVRYSPEVRAAIDEYESRLAVGPEKFPLGYQFKMEPRPYQREALDFVWPRAAVALGLEMGCGKTKVTIDTAAARFLGGQIQQMLVMCPSSIVSTWAEEIKKHCPIRAKIHFELPREPNPEEFQILVVSTEGLGISLKAFDRAADFVRRAPTLSIVDESSWIKEQKAARSQRSHLIGGASKYRMILNGTLINNSPLDLWSQYQFLDPNILGQEWYDFRAQHAIFGGFQGRQILATMRMDEVVRDVAPWTLIIKKADVLKDLPPKIYERREVQPTPEQKALIKEIKKKPLHVELPPEIAVGNVQARMVLERVLRQRQIAAGFVSYLTAEDMAEGRREPRIARLKKSPKTEETMAVLEQTAGKAVIWCTFTEEVEAIRDAIAEVYGPKSVVTFYGKMTKEEQDEARHRLQEDPTCRFFVGNMAVGAIGITLTAASTEIYHSNSFSYLQRAQSEDRLHRLGQQNAVTIVDIVMKGTADELCFDAVMEKRDVAEFITGAIHESRLKQLEVS